MATDGNDGSLNERALMVCAIGMTARKLARVSSESWRAGGVLRRKINLVQCFFELVTRKVLRMNSNSGRFCAVLVQGGDVS